MDKKLMRLLLVLALSLPAFGQQILAPILQAPAASGGGGGIARVGTGAVKLEASSASTVATPAFNVSAGNLIYCKVGYNANSSGCGTTTFSLADTGSANTFTQIGSNVDRTYACSAQFYAKNTTAVTGDVVTATLSSNLNQPAIACEQFSGLSTTAPLDTSTSGTADASPITSSSFTTANANEVIFMSTWDFYPGDFTAGNIGGVASNLGANGKDATTGAIAIEYLIVSATQSGITAAISKTSTVYSAWTVATFTQ